MPSKSRSKDALLMQCMKEFNIPPWPGQALFERVLIYIVPSEEEASETFAPGGAIIKPDTKREIDKARSPRGVIVSAGLAAMDILRGNGMQVGEVVRVAPFVPYRYDCGKDSEGRPIEFMFCNVADVVLSEDILQRLADGELEVKGSNGKHVYVYEDEPLQRAEPTHSPDES